MVTATPANPGQPGRLEKSLSWTTTRIERHARELTRIEQNLSSFGKRNKPPCVQGELLRGERLIWIGGPARWGLFRATPFVVARLLMVGISKYVSVDTGLRMWE